MNKGVQLFDPNGKRRSFKESDAEGIRSFVVQLSPSEETAMTILYANVTSYMGRGAVKAFHGSALHRGIPWTPEPMRRKVWKMSAFFLPDALGFKAEPMPH